MKHLKTKKEITAKNLKAQDCEYKGKRLGFHKDENKEGLAMIMGPGNGHFFAEDVVNFYKVKDGRYIFEIKL